MKSSQMSENVSCYGREKEEEGKNNQKEKEDKENEGRFQNTKDRQIKTRNIGSNSTNERFFKITEIH